MPLVCRMHISMKPGPFWLDTRSERPILVQMIVVEMTQMAIQLTAKQVRVAAIGLVFGCAGSAALAGTDSYSEATGALATNSADTRMEIAYIPESGNDRYDPYTCAAAYGDEFCTAFERCMATYGFDRCYARFSQQLRD